MSPPWLSTYIVTSSRNIRCKPDLFTFLSNLYLVSLLWSLLSKISSTFPLSLFPQAPVFSRHQKKFSVFPGIASHSKQEFSLFVFFWVFLLLRVGRNHSEITASLFCFHFTKSLLYGNLHHSCFHGGNGEREKAESNKRTHKKILKVDREERKDVL